MFISSKILSKSWYKEVIRIEIKMWINYLYMLGGEKLLTKVMPLKNNETSQSRVSSFSYPITIRDEHNEIKKSGSKI